MHAFTVGLTWGCMHSQLTDLTSHCGLSVALTHFSCFTYPQFHQEIKWIWKKLLWLAAVVSADTVEHFGRRQTPAALWPWPSEVTKAQCWSWSSASANLHCSPASATSQGRAQLRAELRTCYHHGRQHGMLGGKLDQELQGQVWIWDAGKEARSRTAGMGLGSRPCASHSACWALLLSGPQFSSISKVELADLWGPFWCQSAILQTSCS